MSVPVEPTGEHRKKIGAVGVWQGTSRTDRTTIVPSTVSQKEIDNLVDREKNTAALTGNKHIIIQSHPASDVSGEPVRVLKTSTLGNVTEIHQQTKQPFHRPLIKDRRPSYS